jgi:hypothetical protein
VEKRLAGGEGARFGIGSDPAFMSRRRSVRGKNSSVSAELRFHCTWGTDGCWGTLDRCLTRGIMDQWKFCGAQNLPLDTLKKPHAILVCDGSMMNW